MQGKPAAAEHTDRESTAGSPQVVAAAAVVLVHAELAASKEDERADAQGSRLVAVGSSQDRG